MSSKQRPSKHSHAKESRAPHSKERLARSSEDHGPHYEIRDERDEYDQSWPQQNQYFMSNVSSPFNGHSHCHASEGTQYLLEDTRGRYDNKYNGFRPSSFQTHEETSEQDYESMGETQSQQLTIPSVATTDPRYMSFSTAHASWSASQGLQPPSVEGTSPWNSSAGMTQWGAIVPDKHEDLRGSQHTISPAGSAVPRTPVQHKGTLLGVDCESMGVLHEKYWRDPQRYSTPASYWNPQRLKKNCLFVSIGYLLGVTAEDISRRLDRQTLSIVSDGPSIGEVERILQMIGGMRIKSFVRSGEESYREKLETQQAFALRKLKKWLQKYGDGPFALGYRRMDGSGHVVVAKKRTSGGGGGHLADYHFICYQKTSRGEDKSQDVKQSFISFAVYALGGPGDLEVDFYEEPLDDISHRTRYYFDSGASGKVKIGYDMKTQPVSLNAHWSL